MKKKVIALLLTAIFALQPIAAFADAAVGDSIVTIGANLNEQQRQDVLAYFNPPTNAQQIEVTIDEERHYLGGSVPAAQIGNGTHSCAMITYTKKGSGIHVTTNNINYVTPSAYESALITAGVTDADVKVTAPFEVSGTGALTGILKAYEVSTGEPISEEVKQAATKELVTNANIAQEVGGEKTTALITDIKKEVAKERPTNVNDIKAIVDKFLKDYNIQLSESEYNQLIDTINQFATMNVDWKTLSKNLNDFAHQANDYLNTPEGQNALARVLDWLKGIGNWFLDLIGASDQSPDAEPATENQ